ncbi:hypothetical protein FPV67DRAFT_908899 [Lyophyllum atratum]|nr:hypothetical protein FPV67DRAFT_908899 [Lyophyllum atratum]
MSPKRPSPVYKLPSELLRAMFICCLPEKIFLTPTRRQAPLLLIQVSSLWRAVALSTPLLWSSMKATYNTPSSLEGTHNCLAQPTDRIVSAALKRWISRATNSPLSISLDGCSMNHGILNVILPHLSRCRHLQMLNVKPGVPRRVSFRRNFIDLETLYVQSFTGSVVDLSEALESAPKLYEVFWEDGLQYGSGYPQSLPALPWPQLKRLTLGDGTGMWASPAILLDCLARCPSLEHADLSVMYLHPNTPRVPILLSSLVTLHLRASADYGDHLWILDYLKVPRLRHLTLRFGSLKAPDLASFVQRSSLLETIQLRAIYVSYDSLIESLYLVAQSLKSSAFAHFKTMLKDSGSQRGLITPSSDEFYLREHFQALRNILCKHFKALQLLIFFLNLHWQPRPPLWLLRSLLPLIIECPWAHTTVKYLRVTHWEIPRYESRFDIDILDAIYPLSAATDLGTVLKNVWATLYRWILDM